MLQCLQQDLPNDHQRIGQWLVQQRQMSKEINSGSVVAAVFTLPI